MTSPHLPFNMVAGLPYKHLLLLLPTPRLPPRANELLKRVDGFDVPGFHVALYPPGLCVEEEFCPLRENAARSVQGSATRGPWHY